MKKPSNKPAAPAPDNPARDDVQAAANRCPFCHERVNTRRDAWLSCARCLARHHEACWSEAPRCGACSCARTLRRARTPRRRAEPGEAARRRRTPAAIAGVGALASVAVIGLALLARPTHRSDATGGETAVRAAEARAAELARAREQALADRHAVELARERLAARDRERLSLSEGIAKDWAAAERREAEAARRREAAEARERDLYRAQNQGRRAFRAHRYREALSAYEEALAHDPKHPGNWHSKGVILVRLKRYREAIDACDAALRLEPNAPRALITRATARRLLGDTPAALRDLDRAIALAPRHRAALQNRALFRKLAGDAAGAAQDRRRLQALGRERLELVFPR